LPRDDTKSGGRINPPLTTWNPLKVHANSGNSFRHEGGGHKPGTVGGDTQPQVLEEASAQTVRPVESNDGDLVGLLCCGWGIGIGDLLDRVSGPAGERGRKPSRSASRRFGRRHAPGHYHPGQFGTARRSWQITTRACPSNGVGHAYRAALQIPRQPWQQAKRALGPGPGCCPH